MRRGAILATVAAVVALLLAWVFRFGDGLPLQTNLLALLPATERNPAAERAAAALADVAGNRAVFLVGHRQAAQAQSAARRLADLLRTSGAFRGVVAELPPVDLNVAQTLYLPYRFGLLSAADRKALEAGDADLEGRLQRRLLSPFRFAAGADLGADPFGFLGDWLAGLPLRNLRLEFRDGFLQTRSGSGEGERNYVLVSAELPGSAYDGEVQRRVLAAVQSAEEGLRGAVADAELLRTGAVFFAGTARAQAEREVDLIGFGSLAGVVLLLLAVFRSLSPLLLGLLSVGIGLVAAMAATLLVHGELHLLTLVFGASLIGEAIDYSIQYFAAHVAAGAAWNPRQALGQVRPGLRLALTTSVLGYAALLLVPFPAIRQIALFALVGLVAAYLSVVWLLPALLRRPYRHDIGAVTAVPARLLDRWQAAIGPLRGALLAALIVLLCLPGWLRLQGDDDVRLLVDRPADLLRQEAKIRELTGFGNSSQFLLVEGETAEQLLQREEALAARLDALAAQGRISHFQAVSAFVPSAARQADNRRLLARAGLGDAARLQQLFDAYGFRDGLAAQQAAALAAGAPALTVEAWLATPLAAPFRHLWLGRGEQGFGSLVLPFGFVDVAPLAAAAEGLPGVTLVDKAAGVSRLFQRYRQWGSAGLALAALVVLIVLARRYGWGGAAATLLPTLLGMGISLAVTGYLGIAVTLFSVMGLMLVLGIGVNYAIFLREGQARAGVAATSVLLSAATTLLSFGLLAFSGTPALACFGATLLGGIGGAVLLAPLSLSFAGFREPACA